MHHIRPVTPSDLDCICRHRDAMFREAGRDAGDLAAMAAPFRAWLEPRLADGRYFGFLAETVATDSPEIVGGVGLMVIDWPPHPAHPQDDRRGYVLNLYVEPIFRGRGVARSLMETAETSFMELGLTYLILHATEMGRPLYEQSGW